MTILWLASILDYLLGDPWGWIHPVQIMGWITSRYKNLVINNLTNKLARKIAGVVLGLILIFGSALLTWLIIYWAIKINIYLAISIQVILLASCFAGKSLRKAAEDVLQYPRVDDIKQARYRYSFYVC